MDWNLLFLYCVAILSTICPIGIVLLLVHYFLWKRKRDRIEWDEDRIIRKVHNMLFELTVECVDILPEKILEVKKNIEGE